MKERNVKKSETEFFVVLVEWALAHTATSVTLHGFPFLSLEYPMRLQAGKIQVHFLKEAKNHVEIV